MVKNSSIPYFFEPPTFISFIFDAPKSEFFSGLMQMIDIFASAYVTSLIFYIMVDYIPAIKQEKNAKNIIEPKLVNLYLYVSELLAMIEYSAKQENLLQSGNFHDIDKIHINDTIVKCKRKTYKNNVETQVSPHSYRLLKDSNKYRTLILDTCNQISATPSFSYCDSRLIHIISEIQLSELLRALPEPDNFFIKCNFDRITYDGLGEGYTHLKSVKDKLIPFVDTKLDCMMIDISEKECAEWEASNSEIAEEVLRQYPQIADFFINPSEK